MTKPIGRLYWNGNSVSGYIVIGNYALKFASQVRDAGTSWIYQSKQQIEQEQKKVAEMLNEVKDESINFDAKYDELKELAVINC